MKTRTRKIIIISVALIFVLSAIFILKLSLKQKSSEMVVTPDVENGQVAKEDDKIEDQWPVAEKEDPEKKLIESSKETSKKSQEKGDSDEKEPSRQNEPKEKTSVNNTEEEADFIQPSLVDWGYRKAIKRQIDTIIIHSSYDALHEDPYELEGLLEEYREYGVAPHFVIDREGEVFQLIDTAYIAYHAGEGQMPDGRENINAFSIGVELMNTREDKYTSEQYQSLNELTVFLEEKYDIQNIIGHQDIAPERKTDPWNFNWEKLESENKTR